MILTKQDNLGNLLFRSLFCTSFSSNSPTSCQIMFYAFFHERRQLQAFSELSSLFERLFCPRSEIFCQFNVFCAFLTKQLNLEQKTTVGPVFSHKFDLIQRIDVGFFLHFLTKQDNLGKLTVACVFFLKFYLKQCNFFSNWCFGMFWLKQANFKQK